MTQSSNLLLSLSNTLHRVFDVVFASICISILLPAFIIIALAIRFTSNGPVIFRQKRVGKNERAYYIYKFRSMHLHDALPEDLGPIKHTHALVTPIGHFIRRTKLDEIPQFFNVLLGTMSMIGPRPCLFSRIETMSKRERRRFDVLPGITGWAEVNGNVELDWSEQLTLDLWYIDHRTFWLDIKILAKTIYIMLRGSVKNTAELKKAERYLRSR